MLHKNPKQRITIPEMKKHPFFAAIDWNKMMKREIQPPIMLALDDSEDEDKPKEDNEEAMFLGEGEKKELFKDKDYTANNQRTNRVKQFTFIKNS
jgi:hypothetical protein